MQTMFNLCSNLSWELILIRVYNAILILMIDIVLFGTISNNLNRCIVIIIKTLNTGICDHTLIWRNGIPCIKYVHFVSNFFWSKQTITAYSSAWPFVTTSWYIGCLKKPVSEEVRNFDSGSFILRSAAIVEEERETHQKRLYV